MRLLNRTFLLACLLSGPLTWAQQDTLRLVNGDVITGRFRILERGAATMSTSYGTADLRVRWNGVQSLRSVNELLVVLRDGTRKAAHIRPGSAGEVLLAGSTDSMSVALTEIVRIEAVERYLLNRIKASVDLGFNHTRASELSQLSLRTKLAYLEENWRAHINFNSVNSFQRGTEDIRRTDLDAGYRYQLPGHRFIGADAVLLANTAQLLRLRSSYQVYVGQPIIHRERFTLLGTGGVAYTVEVFNSEDQRRAQPEGVLGVEARIFNSGPITFTFETKAYPTLSGPGRWRMDSRADARYNFPYGIYLRMGGTVNYDSRPATGAVETDYLFQTAVGWSY